MVGDMNQRVRSGSIRLKRSLWVGGVAMMGLITFACGSDSTSPGDPGGQGGLPEGGKAGSGTAGKAGSGGASAGVAGQAHGGGATTAGSGNSAGSSQTAGAAGQAQGGSGGNAQGGGAGSGTAGSSAGGAQGGSAGAPQGGGAGSGTAGSSAGGAQGGSAGAPQGGASGSGTAGSAQGGSSGSAQGGSSGSAQGGSSGSAQGGSSGSGTAGSAQGGSAGSAQGGTAGIAQGGSSGGVTAGAAGTGPSSYLSWQNGYIDASNIGAIKGYWHTYHDSGSSTINQSPSFAAGGASICVWGNVGQSSASNWGSVVAFNTNQAAGTSTVAGAWDATAHNIAGFRFTLSGDQVPSTIQVNLKVNGLPDTTTYCSKLTGVASNNAQTVSLGSVTLDCFNASGSHPVVDATKIEAIQFQVPSSSSGVTQFNFCVSSVQLLSSN